MTNAQPTGTPPQSGPAPAGQSAFVVQGASAVQPVPSGQPVPAVSTSVGPKASGSGGMMKLIITVLILIAFGAGAFYAYKKYTAQDEMSAPTDEISEETAADDMPANNGESTDATEPPAETEEASVRDGGGDLAPTDTVGLDVSATATAAETSSDSDTAASTAPTAEGGDGTSAAPDGTGAPDPAAAPGETATSPDTTTTTKIPRPQN